MSFTPGTIEGLALSGLTKDVFKANVTARNEAGKYGKALASLRRKRAMAKRVIDKASKRYHNTGSSRAASRVMRASMILDKVDNRLNKTKELAQDAYERALSSKKSLKGLAKG